MRQSKSLETMLWANGKGDVLPSLSLQMRSQGRLETFLNPLLLHLMNLKAVAEGKGSTHRKGDKQTQLGGKQQEV